MKKIVLTLCTAYMAMSAIYAQNVAINTTGAVPDNSAILDISSANSGLLVPRLALTATNAATPVATPSNSLLVYNTATAGAGATAVAPGYYYWDGAQWLRLLNTGNAWQTGGNAGTNPATNFAGTSDAQDFAFRTNNTERMRISSAGYVNINSVVYNQSILRAECAILTPSTDAFAFYNTGGAGGNQWTLNAYQSTADAGAGYAECTNIANNNMAFTGNNAGATGLGTRGFHAGTGAGTGVRGTSNVSVAYGVWGAIPTAGAWTGFGGIFQGGLGYVNGLYNLSDQRFKKNVQDIENPLAIIMAINGKQYEMQSPYSGLTFRPGRNFGFIAQELEAVLPEAVADKKLPVEYTENEKQFQVTQYADVKMVDYVTLIPILVEAIKQQQVMIESQNVKIQELESLIKK